MAKSNTFVQTFPQFMDYIKFIIDLKKSIDDIYIKKTFDKLSIEDILETSVKHPNKNYELNRLKQQYNIKKVDKTFINDIKKNGFNNLLYYGSELPKYSLLEYAIKGLSISNVSYLLERFTSINDCIFCVGFNIFNIFYILSEICLKEFIDYRKCILFNTNNDYKTKRQKIMNIYEILINFFKISILKNNNCKMIKKNYNDDNKCIQVITIITKCNDVELLQLLFSGGVYLPLEYKNCDILDNIIYNSNERDIIDVNTKIIINPIENYIKICKILFENGLEIKSKFDETQINKKQLVKFLFNILLLKSTNMSEQMIYLITEYF
jgi:hypothetical protein